VFMLCTELLILVISCCVNAPQLRVVDKPVKRIAEYSAKYINAFLMCYFGIDDDGIVSGVNLPRSSRDAIRLHIDGIVEAFWPSVDTRKCAIVFVPLRPPWYVSSLVVRVY
jgi:hypothetical protein